MGCSDSSSRKTPEQAARQLDSLFILSNKDFLKQGTDQDMVDTYDVLDGETTSHKQAVTGHIVDKETGVSKFCKTIVKNEAMAIKDISATCNFMGQIGHTIINKVQEVYYSNEKIHLVSNSLKGSHKSLSELADAEFVLTETQVTRIVEKLLGLCAFLNKRQITMGNLHTNNVFIDEDYPEDVLVTDVGFAYFPCMQPSTQIQTDFQAPEIRGKSGPQLLHLTQDAPSQADVWSVGAIAKFLLFGRPEVDDSDLTGCGTEMQDFLMKVDGDNPYARISAEYALNLPLFHADRLARQDADPQVQERRNAQKAIVAARMKAISSASVMEQIMVRFVASAQQNQALLRKCRQQFDYLVQKQNDARAEGEAYEPTLKFNAVRDLLAGSASAAEQQRILAKLDTNFDGRISFEEFQTAMAASMGEQDESMLRASFQRLDVNGDQFLTMDEIVQTLVSNEDSLHRIKKTQGFRNELENFIKQNDTDGNKKLDEAEFVQAMKRFAVKDHESAESENNQQVDQFLNSIGEEDNYKSM